MLLNSSKILLVRTAWMKYYEGRAKIDPPISNAKYILENKTGGEVYNFKNYKGKVFGYTPSIRDLNIDSLGAKSCDQFIKNIIVVFCATHPVEKGMRVVGIKALPYLDTSKKTPSIWGIIILKLMRLSVK